MISEVDIEAWREDEKQTDFLEMRRKADNHVGWAVEALGDNGWKAVSPTVDTYIHACKMLGIAKMYCSDELRVYEVVK